MLRLDLTVGSYGKGQTSITVLLTDFFGLLPFGSNISLHFVPLSVAFLAYIDTARTHEHVGHLFAVGESNVTMDPFVEW